MGAPVRYHWPMIGILGAHPAEIAPLLRTIAVREVQTRLKHEFHLGELWGRQVVVSTCGIGKVRAAARTQFLIDTYAVSRLIFVGVAGAIDPSLQRGNIVVSSQAIEHDFDLSGGLDTRERGAHWYEADKQMVELAMQAAGRAGLAAETCCGKVLTGDQAIHQRVRKEALWQGLGGACVEMEGAAVAMVCWMNQVPFVLVRAISDLAEEGSFEDFRHWFRVGAERCCSVAAELVKTLPVQAAG